MIIRRIILVHKYYVKCQNTKTQSCIQENSNTPVYKAILFMTVFRSFVGTQLYGGIKNLRLLLNSHIYGGTNNVRVLLRIIAKCLHFYLVTTNWNNHK